MAAHEDLTAAILARAERFPRTCAGMARLEDVLAGPSCRAKPEGEWTTSLSNDAAVTQWPEAARSVLVLGLHHPAGDPRLDQLPGFPFPVDQTVRSRGSFVTA